MGDTATTGPTSTGEGGRRSRRGLLQLFGAAAAGGVVAMATSERASAANGSPVNLGEAQTATTGTAIEVDSGPIAYGFGVTDNGLGSVPSAANRSAVLGHAKSTAFVYGVTGYTTGMSLGTAGVLGYSENAGVGVIGISTGTSTAAIIGESTGADGAGIVAVGNGDHGLGLSAFGTGIGIRVAAGEGALTIQQYTTPTAPPPDRTAVVFPANTLDVDGDHNLWWSVTTGPNTKWRKVSGPGTGGAFHPLAPTRVYDSRVAAPHKGQLAGGTSLTISVKDARNPNTGAVTKPNVVPANATAVACTITVLNTVGSGHLSINPGGVVSSTAISAAWNATGQIHTAGIVATLNPVTLHLTITTSGLARTDLVVDVTGYWR